MIIPQSLKEIKNKTPIIYSSINKFLFIYNTQITKIKKNKTCRSQWRKYCISKSLLTLIYLPEFHYCIHDIAALEFYFSIWVFGWGSIQKIPQKVGVYSRHTPKTGLFTLPRALFKSGAAILGPTKVKCRLLISSIFYAMNF